MDDLPKTTYDWRAKALRLQRLLAEVAALDDGDEPFAWKHERLFGRIRAELKASVHKTK